MNQSSASNESMEEEKDMKTTASRQRDSERQDTAKESRTSDRPKSSIKAEQERAHMEVVVQKPVRILGFMSPVRTPTDVKPDEAEVEKE